MLIKQISKFAYIVEFKEEYPYCIEAAFEWEVYSMDVNAKVYNLDWLSDTYKFMVVSEIINKTSIAKLVNNISTFAKQTLRRKNKHALEHAKIAKENIKNVKKVPQHKLYKKLSQEINNIVDELKECYKNEEYESVAFNGYNDYITLTRVLKLLDGGQFAAAKTIIKHDNPFIGDKFPLPKNILKKLDSSSF